MAVMAIGFVMPPRDLAAEPDSAPIGVFKRQTGKAKQCQKEGVIELSILSEMWPYKENPYAVDITLCHFKRYGTEIFVHGDFSWREASLST